ncbi:MAG: nitroreductase family protein, partial [Bacteroidota bacterium]
IEKGLIMRPRRKVFALDYVEETVDSYLTLSNNVIDEDILEWAGQVLSNYFAVVEKNEFLEDVFQRFDQVYQTYSYQDQKVPYERDLSKGQVDFDDFLALSIRRRSVRWYKDQNVPTELIDKALLAANQSPSACNRQPFRYMIFDEPEMVQKIVNIPKGTPGYSHNIKTICVLIGDLSAYFSERDRHVIYIDASLSAMSFILALETLGLSSCCINWPDVEKLEKRMERLLKLKKHERPIMLISVGYPDETGMVPFSQKKSISNLRSYNNVPNS